MERNNAVLAVLIYAILGDRALMIHRNTRAKEQDYHAGKWNGLGGKFEFGESAREAAKRELFEESGIDCELEAFQSRGVVYFPNFKAHKKEDWVVYLFTVNLPGTEPLLRNSREGTLHWVELAKVMELNLWAGDRHFLPQVLRGEFCMGTIWYDGERVKRAEVAGI